MNDNFNINELEPFRDGQTRLNETNLNQVVNLARNVRTFETAASYNAQFAQAADGHILIALRGGFFLQMGPAGGPPGWNGNSFQGVVEDGDVFRVGSHHGIRFAQRIGNIRGGGAAANATNATLRIEQPDGVTLQYRIRLDAEHYGVSGSGAPLSNMDLKFDFDNLTPKEEY